MSSHRSHSHAYGTVRIPGLRWLGTGGDAAPAGFLLTMLGVTAVLRGVLSARTHAVPTALVAALCAAVLVVHPVAMASRPRVRLTGDAQPRWRRVEMVVEELRLRLPRRVPGGRAALHDVARARWEIALLLRDRTSVSGALAEAGSAGYGLAIDAVERAQLRQHGAALDARVAELDRQIDGRTASLERLAAALRSISDGTPRADPDRSSRRARLAGAHADAALAAAARWRDAADPGAELADTADAYAAAFRELSDPAGAEAGWRA